MIFALISIQYLNCWEIYYSSKLKQSFILLQGNFMTQNIKFFLFETIFNFDNFFPIFACESPEWFESQLYESLLNFSERQKLLDFFCWCEHELLDGDVWILRRQSQDEQLPESSSTYITGNLEDILRHVCHVEPTCILLICLMSSQLTAKIKQFGHPMIQNFLRQLLQESYTVN